MNLDGIFASKEGVPMTDSLRVAEVFGKMHKNVLADIEKLDCSEEFRQLNFQPSSYRNQQNKKQPCYVMTKDGFTYLVMGYRGKKASAFKEWYIKKFNEMSNFVTDLLGARDEFPLLTEVLAEKYGYDKPYIFSNEADMINRLVLGMTSKKYKQTKGLATTELLRPHLTLEEIKKIELLQKIDIGLVIAGIEYAQRKEILESRLN